MTEKRNQRIPDEVLAEQWFGARLLAFDKLLAAFRQTGLEQKDIAEILGKKTSQISRWLRGYDNVTFRTLSNLARALDCRLDVEFTPQKDMVQPNYAFDSRRAEKESRPEYAMLFFGATDPHTSVSSTSTASHSRVTMDA